MLESRFAEGVERDKSAGQIRLIRLRLATVALLLALLGVGLVDTGEAQAKAATDKIILSGLPVYGQWHNLSCEYAAARMLSGYWDAEVGEPQFIRAISTHPNPHYGYRGNIDGEFGGTRNYGIYAEPIARVLSARGFGTKVMYDGPAALKQELASGRPVQVWITSGLSGARGFYSYYQGERYKLVPGEHSVVVYGYDQGGVYVADPAFGARDYYSWGAFLRSWANFDYMALSIWR